MGCFPTAQCLSALVAEAEERQRQPLKARLLVRLGRHAPGLRPMLRARSAFAVEQHEAVEETRASRAK
eukprot:s817_g9.t1